jgi:hypothetical protein
MPRVTLGDLKASRVPFVAGACPDSTRLLSLVNESIQRLLNKGFWWGTYGRYRLCVTDGCITLPSGIATIEKAAVCNQVIPVRDSFFEFIASGPGPVNGSFGSNGCSTGTCGSSLFNNGWCGLPGVYARGRFPTFSDVRGVDKKMRFVCDLDSDEGKSVLILGYDENNNWIRTERDGTWQDGEVVELAQAPGVDTDNFFSSVTDIQFPDDMDGQSWLYEYNTTASTQRLIGHYNYSDTRPSFARYMVPGICGTDDNRAQIEILAKLDFTPVKRDTDYLIIGNLPAIKEMVMALNNAEHEPDTVKKAMILKAGYASAIYELDTELDAYLGSGRKIGIEVMDTSVGMLDPIEFVM